jgi:predicted nucleotidyltransferase
MRLQTIQIESIKKTVKKKFGPSSRVWLFGSRVDDNARGGDIDLYVNADLSEDELFVKKIEAVTEIQFAIGERKIDIVTYAGDDIEKAPLVVREAAANGVEL